METAPIILFAYNRPDHCRRTIEALSRNPLAKTSRLIIHCDGPRHPDDRPAVTAVREYVEGIGGFYSINIVKHEENLGLAQSIIRGVTGVMQTYGKAIVMEDDLVVAPSFLQYMNAALRFYEHEEKVVSIHGYTYPVCENLPETFLLRGSDCWGWATWRRGWDLFEADGALLKKQIKKKGLVKNFNRGSFNYYRMLKNQVKNRNDSWAIRWHASAFLENKYTLYPGRSLVNNIGFDNSGTHCKGSDLFEATLSDHPVKIEAIELKENRAALRAFKGFMRGRATRAAIERLKQWFHL